MENNPPKSWRGEVEQARYFRDKYRLESDFADVDDLQPEKITNSLVAKSEKAAELLHKHGLDGRDLNHDSTNLIKPKLSKIPLAAIRIGLFTVLLPIFLLSLLPQIILGRILGDSTDEGIDARTSYQFLAAMFGSIIIWPISSTLIVAALYWQSGNIEDVVNINWTESLGTSQFNVALSIIMLWLAIFPISLFTGRLFSLVWDDYVDLRGYIRKLRFPKKDRTELFKIITEIKRDLSSSR